MRDGDVRAFFAELCTAKSPECRSFHFGSLRSG
jgi:hypothetical protein